MPDPHTKTEDVGYAGIRTTADRLSTGEWSSREVVDALVARIAAVDDAGPELRSVLALHADARATADERDRERSAGRLRGALHGIPVLIKDNIEAVGLPGTAGSLALAGRSASADAPLVARLRGAGAIVLGATNLSEWANFRSPRSTSGWSAVGGLTGNPWALDRSAGGSSSGSGAALAAGLAPLTIGTETNGSITCPSALNGVVGLKPTVGSVPARQVVPISGSQDVPGPMARSVEDAALAYAVLSERMACAHPDPGGARSLRVGVADAWRSRHTETDARFDEVLRLLSTLVAAVEPIPVPSNDAQVNADQVAVLVAEMRSDLDAYLASRGGSGPASVADVVAFNREHADVELAHFGQEFLEQAAASGGRASAEYAQARERNVSFARDRCLGPAYEAVDVIVAPAYQPAWKSDLVHGDQLSGGGDVCTPPAILGWPILTVPMGLVDGLPVGLSITGPAGSEERLLAVGLAVEHALGWSGTSESRPWWRAPARG